jgi:hypothetical protein
MKALIENTANAMLAANGFKLNLDGDKVLLNTARAAAEAVIKHMIANPSNAMISEGADTHNGQRYAGQQFAQSIFNNMLNQALVELVAAE